MENDKIAEDCSMFIFAVNREDLLRKAVESAEDLWDILTVIDNSKDGLSLRFARGGGVLRPPVPLTASQSINLSITSTRREGRSICIWMHNDAEAHPGSCKSLLEYAMQLNEEGRKWGVIFTNYDALSATNMRMIDEVGLWDTNLPSYFSDNDFYRRVELAGYEKINTNIAVDHVGSQTINSDEEWKFMNSMTFPIYGAYYERKWGGSPGRETFTRPFNRG